MGVAAALYTASVVSELWKRYSASAEWEFSLVAVCLCSGCSEVVAQIPTLARRLEGWWWCAVSSYLGCWWLIAVLQYGTTKSCCCSAWIAVILDGGCGCFIYRQYCKWILKVVQCQLRECRQFSLAALRLIWGCSTDTNSGKQTWVMMLMCCTVWVSLTLDVDYRRLDCGVTVQSRHSKELLLLSLDCSVFGGGVKLPYIQSVLVL